MAKAKKSKIAKGAGKKTNKETGKKAVVVGKLTLEKKQLIPAAQDKLEINEETGAAVESEQEITPFGIDLDITFRFGLGEITATHFHDGKTIADKLIKQSGRIHFDDVEANDVISINGVCSGTSTLITNRQTDPPSDSDQPRVYASGNIFDNLAIE